MKKKQKQIAKFHHDDAILLRKHIFRLLRELKTKLEIR